MVFSATGRRWNVIAQLFVNAGSLLQPTRHAAFEQPLQLLFPQMRACHGQDRRFDYRRQ